MVTPVETPKAAPVVAAPQQQFEKSPSSEVNLTQSSAEDLKRQSTVYQNANSGSNAELQNQIRDYKRMIEKEQAEIKGIKEEIQKKGQNISKTSNMP